ncbi:MAG: hypothetical protein JXB62_20495 [Pirellulales bacterium]|nr:hypothetical protein [Pirellulales bacterium]
MIVQPLLLTALTGRPAVYPSFPVGAGTGPSVQKQKTGTDATAHVDQRDTVEISLEAERQLVGELTEEQQRQVQQLKTRDREVRAHEQAHLAAAGPYARGGASFSYQAGPDGRRYAVGGEVSLDTSPVSDDPEATIHKAQVIRAAALAPANPSAQDRRVAATATKMEAQARQELRRLRAEGKQEGTDGAGEAAEAGSIRVHGALGQGYGEGSGKSAGSVGTLLNVLA